MQSTDLALKDNFDSLSWDNDQKTTAREFFQSQWRNTIQSSTREKKAKLDEEIRSKLALCDQLHQFQQFFASVQDQGETVAELAQKHEQIRAQFQNSSAELNYYMSQPPQTFAVRNLKHLELAREIPYKVQLFLTIVPYRSTVLVSYSDTFSIPYTRTALPLNLVNIN